MSLDKIVVFLFSLTGIIFTFWFFLRRKEESVVVENNQVDILVQGGYKPEVITIPQNQTTTINFLRKDSSSCLEEVVLSDFKIKKFLPVDKKVSIQITPKEKGEFRFSCGMNMFHGKLIVK
jgi:plastocyanin domain-containing protein